MATITMLDKARQGRRTALASLDTRHDRTDNVVSIFDFAFDDLPVRETAAKPSNVIAFRSHRAAPAAAAPQVAANTAPSNVVRLAA